MNTIGNNIFINQNTPAVATAVSSNLNTIAAQSIIASQILSDKKELIGRVKKIKPSKSIDPELEHEKKTQREYHFNTEEYERIFMHENHLPIAPKKEKLKEVRREQISHYQEVSENAHLEEAHHVHIPSTKA